MKAHKSWGTQQVKKQRSPKESTVMTTSSVKAKQISDQSDRPSLPYGDGTQDKNRRRMPASRNTLAMITILTLFVSPLAVKIMTVNLNIGLPAENLEHSSCMAISCHHKRYLSDDALTFKVVD